MRRGKQNFRCSFCGRDKSEALILIAGIDGHICEVCVEQAEDGIRDPLWSRGLGDVYKRQIHHFSYALWKNL